MSFNKVDLDPRSDVNKLQRFEDAALISRPNRWGSDTMIAVSQPWKTKELGRVVRAAIDPNLPLTVRELDTDVKHNYRTIEALVLDWRTD